MAYVALVVFCTNGIGTDYIYYTTESESTLSLKGSLGLTLDAPVTGEYQYNNKGDLVIVFNDDINGLRTFNMIVSTRTIDGISVNANKEFIDAPIGLNNLKLCPNFKMPTFAVSESNEGNLPKGTYQMAISYYVNSFDNLNWSYPSRQLYVAKPRLVNMYYKGIENGNQNTIIFNDKYQYDSENLTDKSINVRIDNIDTSFKKYKLALIHRTETSIKVYDMGDFTTTTNIHCITHISNTELSLDEVTIPFIAYKGASDITLSDNRLVLAGPENTSNIDYQPYANNIKVFYEVDTLENVFKDINYTTGDYPNIPINRTRGGRDANGNSIIPTPTESVLTFEYAINQTGILDEVYALYIGLIGKDGTNKGFFHIPGRAPETLSDGTLESRKLTTTELANYNKSDGRTIAEIPIVDYYYQLHNTATSFVSNNNNNKLGYWQNENEFYPNDSDFKVYDVDANGNGFEIDSLIGKNVRHHKMPSFDKLYTSADINKTPTKIIKIKLSNVKIPKDILNQIQGVVVAFANRTSVNSTVVGYHPLINDRFYKSYASITGQNQGSGYRRDGMLPTNPYSNVKSYRFNDFSIINNKPSLNRPYLKSIYTSTRLGSYNETQSDTTKISALASEIRNIKDYKYLPRDNSATDPNNKGREEALALELYNAYNSDTQLLVCELKNHVNNVFAPFYEQRLSICSDVFILTDGQFSYNNILKSNNLDGFIGFYYAIYYRGDQTLTLDTTSDTPTITRNNGDEDNNGATVITVIKCMSISTTNIDMKTMAKQPFDIIYERDRSWLANVFGSSNYSISYDSNFVVDPSIEPKVTYGKEFSFMNSVVPYYAYNYNNVFISKHPHRITRSAIQSKEALKLNWRYFSALEYYEQPKHRGPIVSVTGLDNMLLIHHEHSLYVAKFKDKISISDGDAYIGTADIFDRKPDELIPTGSGKAGIQSKFSNIVTEFGYTFADGYDRTIYNYSNNSFDPISDIRARGLFTKYLTKSDGNPLRKNDVIFGSDTVNKRIFVTNIGSTPFTISFCYDRDNIGWVSFHDYIPCIMVNNRFGCYSVDSNNKKKLYKFNGGAKGVYYDGVKYESYIDVLINEAPNTDKILESVSMQSGERDESNNVNKLFIYTKNQCTKVYDIREFETLMDYDKIRYINDFWNYNFIRDHSNNNIIQSIVDDFGSINPYAISDNKQWYELSDLMGRYFVVRMICSNNSIISYRDLEYQVSANHR